jgi:hypothetical protein
MVTSGSVDLVETLGREAARVVARMLVRVKVLANIVSNWKCVGRNGVEESGQQLEGALRTSRTQDIYTG